MVWQMTDPIKELRHLSGTPDWSQYTGINISKTGTETQQLEKQHNIKPGTPEWFRLWFSLPYFTGEKKV
jgi:hypothetical protein